MLWSALAMGQRTATTLSGKLVDPSGAVVPAAHVTVTETSTGIATVAQVNAEGFYVVPNLEPGTYALRVEAAGFQSFEETGIVIQVGQPRTVDVALKVGTTSTQVVVTSESPLVDTRSQTVSFAVTPQFADAIPLNGRDSLQMVAIAPDTSNHNLQVAHYSTSQLATNPLTAADGAVTSSGEARENTTAYYLDGGLNEDAYTDVANVLPNPDAIEEFTVDTNSYNAKFAGRGGAIVNAVTRSGTNKIHGSAFEYLRNNYVNATDYFATSPDTLKRNQFGFSLGGPLIKDRTFWFGSFQRTTFRYASNSNIAFGPTADELAGNWAVADPTTQLTNPLTGEVYAGNQVPTSEYNPISLKVLGLVPAGDPNTGQINYVLNTIQNDNQFVFKVDHHVGDKATVSASYLWDRFSQPNVGNPADVLTGGATGSFGANQTWTSQHAALNLTYRFGTDLLTTLTGTMSRAVFTLSGNPAFKNDSLIALGASYPTWDPKGSYEVGFSVGNWFTAYWIAGQNVARDQIDFVNNWTYIKGNHTLDFGVEVPFYQSILGQAYVSDGYEGWGPGKGNSGDSSLDFMLGANDFFEQYVPSYVAPRGKAPSLYANDTWRASRRLTLNLGVRWEPWLPWPDSSNVKVGNVFSLADYEAGIHSTRYPNLPPGFLVRGDPGVPDGMAKNDWKLLDPRIGLAWDVFGNGKTSIRAGFGIYHDQPFGRMYNEMTSTLPFNQGAVITASNVSAYTPYNAPPYNGTYPNNGQVPPSPPPSNTVFALPDGYAIAFVPGFQPPATNQWNLTVERQLPKGIVLRTAYEGSESYHMFDSRDINYPTNGLSTGVRPLNPNSYSYEVVVDESKINSSYNALVISAEKRMTGNLSFLGGFRWAKCIDVGGSNSSFAFNEFSDPRFPSLDRARCDSDIAEQFKLATVWRTPTIQSLGFAGRQILGGWSMSGILLRQGGFPFSVIDGSNADYNSFQRADIVGDPFSGTCPSGASTHSLNCWFNPAAFQAAAGADGTSGRNILRGPGLVDVDFGLAKSFPLPFGPLRETQKINFRAEAFNLFNHPNFVNPGNTIGSPSFGRIVGSYATSPVGGIGGPRVLQLALKYIF